MNKIGRKFLAGMLISAMVLGTNPDANVLASGVQAGVSAELSTQEAAAQNTEEAQNTETTTQTGATAGVSAMVSTLLTQVTENAGQDVTQDVTQDAQTQGDAQTDAQDASYVSENQTPEVQSEYADVAIAQVDNYVNVRAEANTDSEVVGKLYNNSAATVLATTEDGWYQITSGNVTGYIKCEYLVVGNEELAKEVSTRYATVTTQTLYVRSEPTTDASVLTMLPEGDDLVVTDESNDGWVKVTTEAGDGYVSTDYVTLSTEYVQAESKEEEEARLAKEEEEREAAAAAAAEKAQSSSKKKSESTSSSDTSAESATAVVSNAESLSNGQAVANFACQFLGNPYVYGGSSLTNGTDCSGFVMSVYANFGISLPHSSAAMRGCGYEVSLSDIQPGDIVCYSGHVGIYVGNNTIISASTEATGIKYTSPVTYKSVISVRRIF